VENIDEDHCMLPLHPHNVLSWGIHIGIRIKGSPIYRMIALASRMTID